MILQQEISKRVALKFVLLISLVSLFADMTYEGARSITGPFLALLGANAIVVGFVSGLGEFVGYGLRLLSGYLADRTARYWTLTLIGYFFNLLAVPLIALAGHWWLAAVLMIIERMGKAIRVPPRDAMLSYAGQKVGMGWVFGLHEAIDQIGAILGPLLVALVLYKRHSYPDSFAILLIPAVIALSILIFARWLYPHPQSLEISQPHLEVQGIQLPFWIYLSGASLIAAGYADFPLIAFHFQKTQILSPVWIPISYAIAMGFSALSALIFGHYYDRRGFSILIAVTIFSCFFAPLVFLGNKIMAFFGVALWSVGLTAHESLMRAIVANMVPMQKRGSAYGFFNTGYGLFWFLGSILLGVLYDFSLLALVTFSVTIQILAIPLFWWVKLKIK